MIIFSNALNALNLELKKRKSMEKWGNGEASGQVPATR